MAGGRMTGLALAALVMALTDAQADTATGPKLLVKGAAARIEIIPEDRTDIVATLSPSAKVPAPVVRAEGQTLVIDGGLHRRIRSCGGRGPTGPGAVTINGIGKVNQADLPAITIRAPRALVAEIANAGATRIGALASGDIDFEGCGDNFIGPVTGDLSVALEGSGDVDFGTVGGRLLAQLDGSGDIRGGAVRRDAVLNLDGSGDVRVESVGGSLAAQLDGSGDIVVATINGPAQLGVDGSGDVLVRGGTAPQLQARVDGSGDVSFLGVAGDVDARVDGSGDVRVTRATGRVNKSKGGSGDISVGS